MKMYRVQFGSDPDSQAWFTAESAEEAASLSEATVLHECTPEAYPDGITVKGFAAVRVDALSFEDILNPDYQAPKFRTWVITAEDGTTQEIPQPIG